MITKKDLYWRLDGWPELQDWLKTQPDMQTAYANCPRGDWLLLIVGYAWVTRPLRVLAVCAVARTVLHYVRYYRDAEIKAPARAIELAEKWAREGGDTTELEAAGKDAHAVASDTSSDPWRGALSGAALAAAVAAQCALLPADPALPHLVSRYAVWACEQDGMVHADTPVQAESNVEWANTAFLKEHADLVRANISWEALEAAMAKEEA